MGRNLRLARRRGEPTEELEKQIADRESAFASAEGRRAARKSNKAAYVLFLLNRRGIHAQSWIPWTDRLF